MITGIANKHPELSWDKLRKMVSESRETSCWFGIDLEFGGLTTGKSVIKTSLASLHGHGLTIDQCEHARTYVSEGGEPCFGYFNKRDFVSNRPRQTFSHWIQIRGDPLQKQVVAHVEYFGIQRIVACLSSKYEGKDFSCRYAIDPVTEEDLNLEVDVDISSDEIQRIYDHEMVDDENITKWALEALLGSLVEIDMQQQ
ncbi:MAG: hypothetical protein OXI05_12645 [Bacteroidota bacterium]|nr:hypothetical protein [Bacteroidota bacterium]MDE2646665.1 hypothetical protein [Bacteroidota bacterium]